MLAGAYYQGTPTVWNSEGAGTSVFPSISGAAAATASAVDTSGNVVGWSTSTTTQYGTKQAFYLPSGGTAATILPDLSTNTTNTYSYSAAQGLNAAGYVVGESVATDGNTHPVVWTNTAGTWSVADLGALDPTIAGWAYAVNSSNVVAGWCNDAVNGFDYQDAATWTYNALTLQPGHLTAWWTEPSTAPGARRRWPSIAAATRWAGLGGHRYSRLQSPCRGVFGRGDCLLGKFGPRWLR